MRRIWLPGLVAVLAATVVNLPILRNFFFADDFDHLVFLQNYGALTFIVQPHAGHMYLVRNTIFWLDHALFDMNPHGYFVWALATHALNVALIFEVARRLTSTVAAAFLGALLFGISPTNPGTIGWYSVYGQALATTLTLTALLLVVRGRDAAAPRAARVLVAAALMLAASQSFGTGTALALVFPVLAALLQPAAFRRPLTAVALCAVPVIVAGTMWVFYSIATRTYPNPEANRNFLILAGIALRPVATMVRHISSAGVVQLLLGAAYRIERYP